MKKTIAIAMTLTLLVGVVAVAVPGTPAPLAVRADDHDDDDGRQLARLRARLKFVEAKLSTVEKLLRQQSILLEEVRESLKRSRRRHRDEHDEDDDDDEDEDDDDDDDDDDDEKPSKVEYLERALKKTARHYHRMREEHGKKHPEVRELAERLEVLEKKLHSLRGKRHAKGKRHRDRDENVWSEVKKLADAWAATEKALHQAVDKGHQDKARKLHHRAKELRELLWKRSEVATKALKEKYHHALRDRERKQHASYKEVEREFGKLEEKLRESARRLKLAAKKHGKKSGEVRELARDHERLEKEIAERRKHMKAELKEHGRGMKKELARFKAEFHEAFKWLEGIRHKLEKSKKRDAKRHREEEEEEEERKRR